MGAEWVSNSLLQADITKGVGDILCVTCSAAAPPPSPPPHSFSFSFSSSSFFFSSSLKCYCFLFRVYRCFACTCLVQQLHTMPLKASRGGWIPCSWMNWQLWAWVPGTEPGSSGREVLNRWAVSPGPKAVSGKRHTPFPELSLTNRAEPADWPDLARSPGQRALSMSQEAHGWKLGRVSLKRDTVALVKGPGSNSRHWGPGLHPFNSPFMVVETLWGHYSPLPLICLRPTSNIFFHQAVSQN